MQTCKLLRESSLLFERSHAIVTVWTLQFGKNIALTNQYKEELSYLQEN
jgi:hypothetical protein